MINIGVFRVLFPLISAKENSYHCLIDNDQPFLNMFVHLHTQVLSSRVDSREQALDTDLDLQTSERAETVSERADWKGNRAKEKERGKSLNLDWLKSETAF